MNWKTFWDGYWESWRIGGPYALIFMVGLFLGYYL